MARTDPDAGKWGFRHGAAGTDKGSFASRRTGHAFPVTPPKEATWKFSDSAVVTIPATTTVF